MPKDLGRISKESITPRLYVTSISTVPEKLKYTMEASETLARLTLTLYSYKSRHAAPGVRIFTVKALLGGMPGAAGYAVSAFAPGAAAWTEPASMTAKKPD